MVAICIADNRFDYLHYDIFTAVRHDAEYYKYWYETSQ